MKIIHHNEYDLLAIILHWLMALMIFSLFGLGLYMVDLNYYDEWYRDAPALHKSVGLCLFFLLCVRVLWRIRRQRMTANANLARQKSLEEKLAAWMHIALYIMIMSICLTGYLIASAGGRDVSIFGLVNLPSLPVEIDHQEDVAGVWHYYLAWCMMLMVACHALAALKHHYIDKDFVLKSILRPSKTKKGKQND